MKPIAMGIFRLQAGRTTFQGECQEEAWVEAWVEEAVEWAAVEVVAWAAAEVWEVVVEAAAVKVGAEAVVEAPAAAVDGRMDFDLHIGIDYSGAQTPESCLKALQVYADISGSECRKENRHRV